MTLQDWAAQRCTISYRAPELFNVESHCIIDERTDIWVTLPSQDSSLFFLEHLNLKPLEKLAVPLIRLCFSASRWAVCCTAWWCWRGRMIWCFRRATAWLWLSRIQSASRHLAGQDWKVLSISLPFLFALILTNSSLFSFESIKNILLRGLMLVKKNP